MQESAFEIRRFEQPDEQLDFCEHGRIDIIKLADGTTGMHAIFEPGWTWSADERPLLGNPDSCPLKHIGYCLRGDLVVRIVETGEERHVRAGDFFEIPPGHDGYVAGDEVCECVFFAAPEVLEVETQGTAEARH